MPSGEWAYPFDILDLLLIFNFRPHLVWTDQESDDEFKSEEDDDDVVDRLDDEHHSWELHVALRVLESCNFQSFKRGLVVLVVSTFCSSSAVEMMKVRVETKT